MRLLRSTPTTDDGRTSVGGDDTITGGAGNDFFYGGGCCDVPINSGNDRLTGDHRITTRDGIRGSDQANEGGGTNSCTVDIGDLVSNC